MGTGIFLYLYVEWRRGTSIPTCFSVNETGHSIIVAISTTPIGVASIEQVSNSWATRTRHPHIRVTSPFLECTHMYSIQQRTVNALCCKISEADGVLCPPEEKKAVTTAFYCHGWPQFVYLLTLRFANKCPKPTGGIESDELVKNVTCIWSFFSL